jgi:hypothetical protein
MLYPAELRAQTKSARTITASRQKSPGWQLSPIVPHHLCDEFAASSRLFDLKGEAKTDRRKQNNPNIVLPTLGDSVS